MSEAMEGLIMLNAKVNAQEKKIAKLSDELRKIAERFSAPTYGPILQEGEFDS